MSHKKAIGQVVAWLGIASIGVAAYIAFGIAAAFTWIGVWLLLVGIGTAAKHDDEEDANDE